MRSPSNDYFVSAADKCRQSKSSRKFTSYSCRWKQKSCQSAGSRTLQCDTKAITAATQRLDQSWKRQLVAPKVEAGHAQSPLLPPYVLDYETSSGGSSSNSAQLTANSGRSSAAGGDSGHYTHTWAVHIPNGDNNGIADAVAKEHGFVNLGKVST
ncbi:hypothetical protein ACLKA7_008854 [Drosophila subpalustris]